MPLELQAKLLRVLQEQEFERLGSTQTQRVNVRVVAATNCDLKKMMAEKLFRTDLYFRLNVFPITIPPLRGRREDIGDLAKAFVSRFSTRMNRRVEVVSDSTMEALTRYDWPGNIRELQNFIERSVILSPGAALQAPLESLSESAGTPLASGTSDSKGGGSHAYYLSAEPGKLGSWRTQGSGRKTGGETYNADRNDAAARDHAPGGTRSRVEPMAENRSL